jgi:glycosyltransferase involved in cell wall biosynthesis
VSNVVRVLHLCPYFPPHIGGLQNHVDILSRMQRLMGHETSVLSSAIGGGRPFERDNGGPAIRRLPSFELGNDAFMVGLMERLRRHRNRFDILHLHGHLFYSTTMGALARRLHNVPTVMTFHGDFHKQSGIGRFSKRLRDALQGPFILKNLDRMIALTTYDADYLEERGADPARIEIIPNGVDLGTYHPISPELINGFRERHHIPTDASMVLFVGRLVDQKGLPFLLEAMPELRRRVPEARLMVVGEGPELGRARHLARTLGIDDAVSWTGRLSEKELVSAYNTSQVVAVPSLWEGMPLVILEAAACGKPVVASNVSGMPEFIEEGGTGFTVNPRDPGAMAGSIEQVLEDNTLARRMSDRARKKASGEFDLKVQVSRTLDLYQRVMENA